MYEGYAGAAQAGAGSASISRTPVVRELGERGVDVGHLVGDVMHPGTLAGEEAADRRVLGRRREQLDMAVADVEQDGLDALGLDDLAMGERHPEGPRQQRDGRLEFGDCYADVVDAVEHRRGV